MEKNSAALLPVSCELVVNLALTLTLVEAKMCTFILLTTVQVPN
jgi:hypothetical protein